MEKYAIDSFLSTDYSPIHSYKRISILMTNSGPQFHGNPQKMTMASSEVKGLKAVLTECGFYIKELKTKCSPVFPFKTQKCCLAWLLSQQDNFLNQESILKTLVKEAGHKCLLLPKLHCELNPIEMVSLHNFLFSYHTYGS